MKLSTRTNCLIFNALFFLALPFSMIQGQEIRLYTPYTKISVPPGQSIDYAIEVKNTGSSTDPIDLAVTGIPRQWEYTLKSGGWNLKQLMVLPGESKSINLTVSVPLNVNKGNYSFKVTGNGQSVLPLTINVSEQGTFKTEFTCNQPNMQGNSKSTFTYRTKLHNLTGEKQLYSLRADLERGWRVVFKPDYQQATSVELDANQSKDITIEVNTPELIEAGTYTIPVAAVTRSTSSSFTLEAVVTGTYDMDFTTPTGLLSTRMTAGDTKRIDMVLKNSGSATLKDVKLSSTTPANWEVTFEPKSIEAVEAGQSVPVTAIIKASKKAIAGDYAATFTATTPETSSKASFRIVVKTPMVWGWIGVMTILACAWGIFLMIRKYGRR